MGHEILRRVNWLRWYLGLPQSRARMLIAAIWAIPAVFVIRTFPRFRDHQFGTFWVMFIGHYVVDACVQIGRLKGIDSAKRRWYWLGQSHNTQWDAMVRRSLNVNPLTCAIEYWNRKLPGGDEHSFQSHWTDSRDLEGLVWSTDCQPAFTAEENEHGAAWLTEQGIPPNDFFVTLIVRDGKYTKDTWHQDLSFHDYRNSDISTFVPSVEWLANQGVWVIRMGKIMETPIPIKHPRVIDYAFLEDRNDFLDIWLMANASGCISTATGIDGIAHVYRRPILFVNAMPLGIWASYTWSTCIPKDLMDTESGRILSATENLERVYSRSSEYTAAGLEVVALTPSEILEEVQDWWELLMGRRRMSQGDKDLLQDFIARTQLSPETSKRHGWIHPEARIGRAWLRRRS
ncbi:MAG: hypothetical protein JW384_03148 [Nitrosomonadaceae bacterium]|nr:hypothetical protein [Nitrosomonadaceae bacterium]